jgi:L-alanine-DL-glutamate epimerase-like enolase superfamily enzyme
MKIVSLECQPVRMNLSEPYTIAYETITGCTNVFIKAVTDNGIRGAGCAAPDLAVTGETGETVLDDYRRFIEPNLKGSNPFHYVRIIEQLKGLMPHSPSALRGRPVCLCITIWADTVITSLPASLLGSCRWRKHWKEPHNISGMDSGY